MMGAFYTSIGTAVHSTVQKYLAPSGAFLADYYCHECSTLYKFTHKPECCDFPTEYRELEVSYKGVVGHIDGIFRTKDGKYWIIDYKTTSLKGVIKKLEDPGKTYQAQIIAYAVLLLLQYKIKVEGVALIFIPRDTPKEPHIWEKPIGEQEIAAGRRDLRKWRDEHREIVNMTKVEQALPWIKKRCDDPWCRPCRKTDAQLRHILETGFATRKFPLLSLKKRIPK